MEAPSRPRIPSIVHAAVVVACVVSTGTLLALGEPPPSRVGVTITRETWTIAWEPNLKANSTWFPRVVNCSAQTVINDTAGNFSCALSIDVYADQGPFSMVWIRAVEVAPPFSFINWEAWGGIPPLNTEVTVAVIGLPPSPGSYELNGTILLGGSVS